MKNERNKSDITKALYETDGLIMEFTANVISCERIDDKYALILDETAFFPEGGGQQHDEGTIDGLKVIDVLQDDDGQIIHYVESMVQVGKCVEGVVDADIRLSRMQNHGAEHLLSGLIHKEFGYDNVGFHMSKDMVTFDVSGELSVEDIKKIERRANEIVRENVPITVSFPTEEEAKKLDYRSKLDIYENVRLIYIGEYDVCACCAPHLYTTGQFGVIKILDAIPHRQGTRIVMLAGMNAYDDYSMLLQSNNEIMAMLSSKRELTAEYTQELIDRTLKLKEENTALRKELSRVITEQFIKTLKMSEASDDEIKSVFTEILDNVGMRNMINECVKVYSGVVAGFIGNDADGYRYIIATEGKSNISGVAKGLNERFSGKGGGSSQMIQGSLCGKQKDIEDFLGRFIFTKSVK